MTILPDMGKAVPLWSVIESREEFNRPDLPLLTVVSASGVQVRDTNGGRAPSEDLSGYRVVRPGDLVVNRLWARFGAYGTSEFEGIISPAYWVLRVDERQYHPRYLHHLLRTSAYLAEIARLSKDMPPNGYDLPWDQFRLLPLPDLSLSDQARDCEVLDRQTRRLNELVGLIEERKALARAAWERALLDRLAQA